MTRSFIWSLAGMLLVFLAACTEFEKPTEPNTISDIQLVNPCDTNYLADSLAPPRPQVWVESIVRGLRIRFNGQFSETTLRATASTPQVEPISGELGQF
jgi:hypothetical protein